MIRFTKPRSKKGFDPGSESFKLSRSKLDMFLNCPRCFYLDRKHGITRPPSYPFTLNNAVDNLLKKEFDYYRSRQEPHPLMLEAGIDAVPFDHPRLNEWRDALHAGIQYKVPGTNIILTGGIDDVWIGSDGKLILVDYKATSKAGQVSLDADWQIAYKRQIEIYQYLFMSNGFDVSKTAYFVYCNGKANNERFDKHLDFDISVLPYEGDIGWVEKAVSYAYNCLCMDDIPDAGTSCAHCKYVNQVSECLSVGSSNSMGASRR